MIIPFYRSVFEDYRYGFQGQEKDDEIKGTGNSVNYKYRMHDTRLGRFFAVDPLTAKYPFYTPYSFSGNRVIDMVELEGLEPAPFQDEITKKEVIENANDPKNWTPQQNKSIEAAKAKIEGEIMDELVNEVSKREGNSQPKEPTGTLPPSYQQYEKSINKGLNFNFEVKAEFVDEGNSLETQLVVSLKSIGFTKLDQDGNSNSTGVSVSDYKIIKSTTKTITKQATKQILKKGFSATSIFIVEGLGMTVGAVLTPIETGKGDVPYKAPLRFRELNDVQVNRILQVVLFP